MPVGEVNKQQYGFSNGIWHMNGSSADDSGRGFNGTDTSMTYLPGKFGQCANFSGTGYITLGNVNNFERTDSWSAMLWFNHGVSTQGSMIHKQKNSSPFNGWYITKFNTPTIRIGMTGSDGSALFGDTPLGYEDSNWHHLAMLYDGSQTSAGLKCMIDGAFVNLSYTTGLAANVATAFNLIFGAREVSGFPYTGKLDEVVINSPSLTQKQVKAYYAWAKGNYATVA